MRYIILAAMAVLAGCATIEIPITVCGSEGTEVTVSVEQPKSVHTEAANNATIPASLIP
jgi:alcohol dehydrogenase class IV